MFGLLPLSVLTPRFVFNILLLNVGYRMKLLVFDTLLLGVWISDKRLLVFDVLLLWISDESLHVFLTSDETLLNEVYLAESLTFFVSLKKVVYCQQTSL